VSGVVASGCSTFRADAVRIGDERVSVRDFEDELEALSRLEGIAQVPALTAGAVPGDAARFWLSNRIEQMLQAQELARRGASVTDADRDEAKAALTQGVPGWDTAPQAARDLLVDIVATQQAFQNATSEPREQIEADYAAGAETVGFTCLRVILFDASSSADVDVVLDELAGGTPFAELASQYSDDPTTAQTGGIVTNPQGGTCGPWADFAQQAPPEVVAAVAAAEPGTAIGPIESGGLTLLLQQRPFDEVAEEITATIQGTAASAAMQALVQQSDVWVSPRYGRWEPQVGSVV
jgi:parvulin-like peptidyl-prolyl isomerase